jgi:hypothetical protein
VNPPPSAAGYFRAMLTLALSAALASEPGTAALRDDVELSFSAVDLPANLTGGAYYPSMRQSLELGRDTYEVSYWGVRAVRFALTKDTSWRGEALEFALSAPLVYFAADAPVPFSTWVHEEYHRSALRVGGVTSKNGSHFRIGHTSGTVYDVSDDELIAIERDHPADFLRSEVAGFEAQHDLVVDGVYTDFHERDRSSMPAFYLWNVYYLHNYFELCASPESDKVRDWNLEHQPKDPLERDFVGLDCTAWAYDLHRPGEAYEARGPHPSGQGLARPIGWSQLTDEERAFLQNSRRLIYLNALNPMAFFVHHVSFGETDANALVQYVPAPFGGQIELHVLLRGPVAGWTIVGRHLWNLETVHPGIEVRRVDQPLRIAGTDVAWTPRVALWTQPPRLDPYETGHRPGGLVGSRFEVRVSDHLDAVGEIDAKTEGWLVGEPFLGANVSARLGLQAHLGR